jgi:hypothetical protein
MLGRKDYTREELERGKAAVKQQLAAYKKLAKAMGAATDKKAASVLADFETNYFNNLTIVLDRYYVHRVRTVTRKDANPLNEVELITESLMANDGVLRTNNVIKYVPEQTVVKLQAGDKIKLTQSDFERLSAAFFAELERKFL